MITTYAPFYNNPAWLILRSEEKVVSLCESDWQLVTICYFKILAKVVVLKLFEILFYES